MSNQSQKKLRSIGDNVQILLNMVTTILVLTLMVFLPTITESLQSLYWSIRGYDKLFGYENFTFIEKQETGHLLFEVTTDVVKRSKGTAVYELQCDRGNGFIEYDAFESLFLTNRSKGVSRYKTKPPRDYYIPEGIPCHFHINATIKVFGEEVSFQRDTNEFIL